RPEPLRKSASQQAYGRGGRARLAHPAHRPSEPERTFDVLRRPDIFTCPRQRLSIARPQSRRTPPGHARLYLTAILNPEPNVRRRIVMIRLSRRSMLGG